MVHHVIHRGKVAYLGQGVDETEAAARCLSVMQTAKNFEFSFSDIAECIMQSIVGKHLKLVQNTANMSEEDMIAQKYLDDMNRAMTFDPKVSKGGFILRFLVDATEDDEDGA